MPRFFPPSSFAVVAAGTCSRGRGVRLRASATASMFDDRLLLGGSHHLLQRPAIPPRMTGYRAFSFDAKNTMLVQNLFQIPDLVLLRPQCQADTRVVPVAIELLLDDGRRSTNFKQRPNHVEIVGTDVSDRLIDPADGQKQVSPEQQEMPEITGAIRQALKLVIGCLGFWACARQARAFRPRRRSPYRWKRCRHHGPDSVRQPGHRSQSSESSNPTRVVSAASIPVLIAAANDGRCRRKTRHVRKLVLKTKDEIEIGAGGLVGDHYQNPAGDRLLHRRSKTDGQELVALRANGHDDCCLIVQIPLQHTAWAIG